ncbi:hypothetical protein [Leptolyngbya sp. AN10]|uniref:DNA polymerase III subunit beta family protein n=1 Tax=Leptolyngbya sp. AN10 TaxID=3423365 RepID=UPI003D318D26
MTSSLKPRKNQLPNSLESITPLSANELAALQDLETIEDLAINERRGYKPEELPELGVDLSIEQKPEFLSDPLCFECGQWIFAQSLNFIQPYAPTKPTQPILNSILIRADQAQQSVTLTVTDLVATATATFKAKVESSGEIALPIDRIATVIRTCPIQGQIRMWTGSNPDGEISGHQGEPLPSSHFNAQIAHIYDSEDGYTEIYGQAGSEYPNLANISNRSIFLPVKVVLAALQSVLPASSSDNTKVPLNAVRWQLNPQTEILECHATDGHQVAITQVKTKTTNRRSRKKTEQSLNLPKIEATIPAKLLRELVKTLERSKVNASFRITADDSTQKVKFELKEDELQRSLTIRCYDAPFPNCPELLARYDFVHTASFDKAGLTTRLERLNALVDKEVDGLILQFDARQQKARLTIERDFGKGMQTIAAQIPEEIDAFGIKLNIKYLKNAVNALRSSRIDCIVDSASTPCKIQSSGETDIPDLDITTTYFVAPQYDQSRQKLREVKRP